MKYKFRLVFHHSKPGFFHIDRNSLHYRITEHQDINVYPRDSDLLSRATKYHIDGGGFGSEADARRFGEKLRKHLRMLNGMLGLGLTVPTEDATSGSVNDEIKEKIRAEGGVLLDTIVGLSVFPDDETHLEHVSSGNVKVFPSDPLYVLKAITATWPDTFVFDEQAAEVIEILNISVRESSPKVKFLTTYLAMEQLIKREMRSENACVLIDKFISLTQDSTLSQNEKISLEGSLGYLKEQSFSSAFGAFAKRITSPTEINGMPIRKFVSKCIKLRNKIAHKSKIDEIDNLEEHSKGLREMVFGLLWAKYNLPKVSFYRPADTFSIEKMEIKLL